MKAQYYKSCERCGTQFAVRKQCLLKVRKYCSHLCADTSQRTLARRTQKCECCAGEFEAVMNGGRWPRFCGVSCQTAGCLPKTMIECAQCGSAFETYESRVIKGRGRYCSKKCANLGARNGTEHQCPQCGAAFHLSVHRASLRGATPCCSKACAVAYFEGPMHPMYRGGYVVAARGEKQLYMPRPGYVGKYMAEHWLVASRAIGRTVKRGEVVLRVNRVPTDNRPENLFICTRSEGAKRCSGTLPWPVQSNLADYCGDAVA